MRRSVSCVAALSSSDDEERARRSKKRHTAGGWVSGESESRGGAGDDTGDECKRAKALSRSDLRQVELLGRSLSSHTLEDELLGQVLVLARCRRSCQLSWRRAFFAVSSGGILRIFRNAEDRAKWQEVGTCAENLAKWRSAISDAHVVSCMGLLPSLEAEACRRVTREPKVVHHRQQRCLRARFAALGSIDEDDDDQNSTVCDGDSFGEEDDEEGPVVVDDDDDEEEDRRRRRRKQQQQQQHRAASTPVRRVNSEPDRHSLLKAGCSTSPPPRYHTFDVWLRNDIADPNAKPVLKFAGTHQEQRGDNILALHHALLSCSHHFQGPKQTATFDHPLLAQYPNALSLVSS